MDVCCCLREDWVQDGWSFSIRTDQTGYVRNVSGMRCRTVHKRRNDIERQVTDMKMCPQLPFFSFLFYYRQISINDVPFLFTWFGDKTGLMGWNDNPEGLKFQSGTTFASFSPTLILCFYPPSICGETRCRIFPLLPFTANQSQPLKWQYNYSEVRRKMLSSKYLLVSGLVI